MKFPIIAVIATTILAGTGAQVQAATTTLSKFIRVETPATNPALAQENAQAFYLHLASNGAALLYVEVQNGRGLAVLDVTDPAKIQRVAETELPRGSAFDFIRNIGDNAALLRYRDGSGFALLNVKNSLRPVLVAAPAFAEVKTSESLGQTGQLVVLASATTYLASEPQTYRVLDTSNNSTPVALATIPGVTERVENSATGTLFLLNGDGVTVVRRLRVEAEHEAQLSGQ